MGARTKLGDLLLEWDDRRKRNEHVPLEVICPDSALRIQLEKQIKVLEAMDEALEATEKPRATSKVLRPGAEPIPGYKLVQRLGRGGSGEVWKALGPGDFPLALKFVPMSNSLAAAEKRSLEILRAIRHPHLLPTTASWELRGFLVIAMELADGTLDGRLQQVLAQGHAGIPREELLRYMQHAAEGIDFLNKTKPTDGSDSGGIQHRDIKPQNILLVGSIAKIGDFGLARILEHSLTGHTGGLTMAYAAPEFFEGHTSQASDQYSLAVAYCQLRGGRLPFTGNAAQIMRGHLEGTPDLSMLPEGERPIVARALAKVPKQRWSTCVEFIEGLTKGDQTLPSRSAPSAHAAAETIGRRFPRELLTLPRNWVYAFFGIVALTLVGIGAATLYQIPSQLPRVPKIHKNLLDMEFVLIAKGESWFGGGGGIPGTRHVRLSYDFYLGKYEVTQKEWSAVMNDNPSHFSRSGKGNDAVRQISNDELDMFPVESVTWEAAQLFIERLNDQCKETGWRYRLPTEIEWEYACRGGPLTDAAESAFDFYFDVPSNNCPENKANINDAIRRTTKVGNYLPNRCGLYDMHGNVWEWCNDRDFDMSNLLHIEKTEHPKLLRVERGGCWHDGSVLVKASARISFPSSWKNYDHGLRVARVPTSPYGREE